MERFVEKYFQMLGLEQSLVTSIDDPKLVGIITRNDFIVGTSTKKDDVITAYMNEDVSQKEYRYEKIVFKKLPNESVEGTITLKSEKDKKNVIYNINEKDKRCIIEVDNYLQIKFDQSEISSVLNNTHYSCKISNVAGNSEEREAITDIIYYLHEIVPELTINILDKYDPSYSDYIYEINKHLKKTKQLTI